MAGIFESVDLPGVAAPTVGIASTGGGATDYSGTVRAAGELGLRVRGKLAVEGAAEDIAATKQNFLNDLDANRKDIAEIDALTQENPIEGAAFKQASQRIKTLQQAIESRQINPSVALTRIEAAKREALMKAPMFVNEINSLTSGKGGRFNHEADMLMKRAEIRNEAMTKMGLSPDIPSNVDTYNQITAAATVNQFQENQAAITSRGAAVKLGQNVTSGIQLGVAQADNLISQYGSMEQIPSDVRTEFLTNLQSMTNGGELAVVEKLLQQTMSPEEAAMVDDKTRARYAAIIRSHADIKIKQFDGSIPNTVSTNDRAFYENKVLNNIALSNPALHAYIVVQSKIPGNSLGGSTVQKAAGIEFSEYTLALGLGTNIDGITKTGLEGKDDGGLTPREIQEGAAANMGSFREWMKTAQNPDPAVASAHFSSINNQARFIAQQPKEFTPKIFDELISSVNDDKFMQVFSQLDPSMQQEFTENMRTAAQVYARENMAVDMSKQLDKEVWVDFAAKGRKSGGYATVRDLVTPLVTGNGVIQFVPVKELTTPNDLMRANQHAERLNKMYSSKSLAVVNAAQKLGGLSDDLRREYTIRNFSDAMGNVAKEPLREKAQEADEGSMSVIQVRDNVKRLATEKGLTEVEVMEGILSGEVEVSKTFKDALAFFRTK